MFGLKDVALNRRRVGIGRGVCTQQTQVFAFVETDNMLVLLILFAENTA